MHETISVTVFRVNFLEWATWVYRVRTQVLVYSLYICGRPAEVQPRPDARVVSAIES